MRGVCNGCGGIIGRECFNPPECEWIAREQKAAYYEELEAAYYAQLQAEHDTELAAPVGHRRRG